MTWQLFIKKKNKIKNLSGKKILIPSFTVHKNNVLRKDKILLRNLV
jgi:hypothetical protein